jgi:hypothetical protein
LKLEEELFSYGRKMWKVEGNIEPKDLSKK